MKAKLFTHNDLDGVVSNIIALRYFMHKRYSVSTEICSYDSVDKNIMGYLNSWEYDPKTVIVITDISFSEGVAETLDKAPNQVIMIDHHKTALELYCHEDGSMKYDWMEIKEGDSASFLTYKYFYSLADSEEMKQVIQSYKGLVYLTDLWDTKSRESQVYKSYEEQIKSVLGLFGGIGFNGFKERFTYNPSIDLTPSEEAVVSTVERIKKRSINNFRVYTLDKEYRGERVFYGFGFASEYVSELAEHVFMKNENFLFIMMLDLNSCSGSLRRNCRHKFGMEFDVEVIAKQFGGGGHPFAAGFGFEIKYYDTVVKKVIVGDFEME